MKYTRVLLAVTIVVFVSLVWNGLVHLVFLGDAESAISAVGRPPQERNLWLGVAITIALAFLFVLSFVTWRRGGVRAGLSHGIFFSVLAGLLVDANQYFLYPIPASLALKWFAFGVAEFCIDGVIVGLLFPGDHGVRHSH